MKAVAEPPEIATPEVQSLNIRNEVTISASKTVVWETLLDELGMGGTMPDGTPFPKKLEAWPGGRWFRDLGNNAGHLLGHVQVIKPPNLLEICGPFVMSYPAVSHIQYRLTDEAGQTRLTLIHRAMGHITPEHREGMIKGWGYMNQHIKERSQK